jgi:hypothetical protein
MRRKKDVKIIVEKQKGSGVARGLPCLATPLTHGSCNRPIHFVAIYSFEKFAMPNSIVDSVPLT